MSNEVKIPKRVFIVPYRNRIQHKFFFSKYMSFILENDELEELEKEFFELFQKMRKHNTKRIYKTSKDLYKLFKKNKYT